MGRKAALPSHCTCKQHVLAPLMLLPSSSKLQKYIWATCSTQTAFSGRTSTTETREMLGGQSSVVRVSLMPGKEQVSVSFRTKCGFCAHLCHKALRKKPKGNKQDHCPEIPGTCERSGSRMCSHLFAFLMVTGRFAMQTATGKDTR